MDAQPLYDGKYCWKPMLCGNDRITCQSASPPPSFMLLVCVTQKKKGVKKGAGTSVCTASDYCFFCSVLLVSSQIRALLRLHGMLFVHQANHLLKLYVFLRMLSLWHTASRGGALPII